jgi:hypothetical protein
MTNLLYLCCTKQHLYFRPWSGRLVRRKPMETELLWVALNPAPKQMLSLHGDRRKLT